MMAVSHKPENHGRAGLPWLTAAAVGLAMLLWLGFGPAPEALVFDRAAIASGEVWRLISGHWVHSDGAHALWDICALAIIGYLMEEQGRWRMLAAMLLGMLAVDVCVWFFMPALERYCGLSGMLNSLFVIGLAGLWWRYRHPVFLLAGPGLCLKLLLEIAGGQSLVVATAWPSVPLVHLAGSLAGLLAVAGFARLGFTASGSCIDSRAGCR